MYAATLTEKFQISIPKALREEQGLNPVNNLFLLPSTLSG